ncbi:MAG TPA: methionine adenosyltransferase, partial [archaeon]|nr:methionine adenosyltransferase [archaeon]
MSKDKNIHTHMGKGTMTKDLPIEIVERKGKGHPDSLTDKAAEELSVALCNYYVEHFGRVLHHNVDKAVLVGGQSTAAFGGGEITEPIYLMLVGRAVTKVKGKPDVPVGEFAVKGTKTWLEKEMPSLDVANDIVVDYRVKPGSVDLVGNYDVKTGDTTPLANDTSFGVGFAPYTDLEAIVKETEQMINGEKYKKKLPEVGQDVKIMGVRDNGKLRLTVAAAMISPKIKDKSHYVNVKEQLKNDVLDFAAKKTTLPVEAFVNTADN